MFLIYNNIQKQQDKIITVKSEVIKAYQNWLTFPIKETNKIWLKLQYTSNFKRKCKLSAVGGFFCYS